MQNHVSRQRQMDVCKMNFAFEVDSFFSFFFGARSWVIEIWNQNNTANAWKTIEHKYETEDEEEQQTKNKNRNEKIQLISFGCDQSRFGVGLSLLFLGVMH